jgi:predicted esterase
MIVSGHIFLYGKERPLSEEINYISALKDTLRNLADATDNEFFRLHCESMIAVIESKDTYTSGDSALLEDTYIAYNNEADTCNPKDFSTYLKRRRSLILSWLSPTDGAVSFSWLKLPKNWDPETEYPLFIQLHGLWDVAGNVIQYLTYPYLNTPSTSISFEEGYLLSPWGRGNLWYQGISETDIWECIDALEDIAHINPARKYLSGHSMGGYGTWHIAINSPKVWAAIGIHAGALWYGGSTELNETVAAILRDVPVYFVCGTQDALLSVNQQAYQLLQNAGNLNLAFVTFDGGHEYLEKIVLNMYLWMKGFVNDDLNNIETISSRRQTSSMSYYPNPFSSGIQIQFNLPDPGYVSLKIYNYLGQLVETLVEAELPSGEYKEYWIPETLPVGIYHIILKTKNGIETSKVVLSR